MVEEGRPRFHSGGGGGGATGLALGAFTVRVRRPDNVNKPRSPPEFIQSPSALRKYNKQRTYCITIYRCLSDTRTAGTTINRIGYNKTRATRTRSISRVSLSRLGSPGGLGNTIEGPVTGKNATHTSQLRFHRGGGGPEGLDGRIGT